MIKRVHFVRSQDSIVEERAHKEWRKLEKEFTEVHWDWRYWYALVISTCMLVYLCTRAYVS